MNAAVSGPAAIAGLVLMGGRARRMGGGDKALIALGGETILAHALKSFRRQVGAVALSANGDPARLAAYGLPVLPDDADDLEGPLAGVRAGLAWAAGIAGVTHLATIPGDAPSPPDDLVSRLWAGAGGGGAFAVTPDSVEPLHALWPLSLASELDRFVREGVRSPRLALAVLGAVEVHYSTQDGFRDIDTPADLAAAKISFRDA